jgi:hypothetical protein
MLHQEKSVSPDNHSDAEVCYIQMLSFTQLQFGHDDQDPILGTIAIYNAGVLKLTPQQKA